MKMTELLKIAALGAATGARVSAAPAALAWSASPSDPPWLRSPVARGATVALVAGEAVGDQLARTKSRLVPVQLVPRLTLSGLGGAVLARRSRQPLLLGAAAGLGGSLVGIYAGLCWRSWAASQFGRDNYGAVTEDALAAAAAILAVR